MSRRLLYLASARRDLIEILRHITRETGDLGIGRGFTDALRERCRTFASLPGTLGRARSEIRPDIRSIAWKGYVIFFRYGDETFEVINIFEGHRDVVSFFKDDQ